MNFEARKKSHSLVSYFVVFGFFFAIGLIFLSGVMDGVGEVTLDRLPSIKGISSHRKIGIVLTLFSGFALTLLTLTAWAVKRYYKITSSSIEVGMGPLSTPHNLFFIDIDDVKIVGHEVVEDNITKVYSATSPLEGGFGGFKKNMRDFMDNYRYSTEPIFVNTNENSPSASIEGDFVMLSMKSGRTFFLSPSAMTEGDFVMLSMKSGRTFFLSPVDVNGLYRAIAKRLPLKDI